MVYLWKLSCVVYHCSISDPRDSFGMILYLLSFFKELIFLSLIEALRKVALVYRLSKKHQLIMADAFQLILICFKKKMSWVFFKWLTSCFLSNLLGILVVDIIFFKLN